MYSGKLFGDCEVRVRVMRRDFIANHPDERKGIYVSEVFSAMAPYALGLNRVKAIGDALTNQTRDEAWVRSALAYAVRSGFLRSRQTEGGRAWEVNYATRN